MSIDFNKMNFVQLGLLIACVNDYIPKLNPDTLDYKDLVNLRKSLISAYKARDNEI